MRVLARPLFPTLIAAFLLAIVPPAAAQVALEDLRLPISLDAESTNYDGKNSMLMFEGLRLSQGNIGVVADVGRASKLDFEDSTWQFSGNVRIDVEGGHIDCDAADLRFRNHVLTLATIEGAPATFELRRPDSEDVTYAEAEQLRLQPRQRSRRSPRRSTPQRQSALVAQRGQARIASPRASSAASACWWAPTAESRKSTGVLHSQNSRSRCGRARCR